jgi:NAD(P)-dependent dehydrogenase (short-subunit alcohol dehydrogenase family)
MNRIVLITGGSGGLGKKLTELFTKDGDTVCSLSRSNKDGYKYHFDCDVTDEESVKKAVDSAASLYGKIDMLICNAGIGLAGALETTPSDMVKSVFDVNFFGALYTVKAALNYMKEGSKIIAVSSAAAFFSLPYRSIYSASKSALNMMFDGLNMELKKDKIQVCSVCPGEIDTPFGENRLWHRAGKYENDIQAVAEKLKAGEKRKMTAEAAAKKIFDKVNKRRLPPVFIIGAKYRFFYFMSKIMPKRLLLYFTTKKYVGKV